MPQRPKHEIVFDDFSRRRPKQQTQRVRGPRTPSEPWSEATRVAYRNAYEILKRNAVRIGSDEDQCLHLQRTTKVTVSVVTRGSRPQQFRHLPYKLAYLKRNETNPIDGTEISHLCGDVLCINPNHMIAENHRRNAERYYCHKDIKEWIKQQRHCPRGKHTFRTCGKGPCRHGTEQECFVVTGQTQRRSHKRRPGSRSFFSQRHLIVFQGTRYSLREPRKSNRLSSVRV